MTTDDIVNLALRSISFADFQSRLEVVSKYEAMEAEARDRFEREFWADKDHK
jgi:hypothetical protein